MYKDLPSKAKLFLAYQLPSPDRQRQSYVYFPNRYDTFVAFANTEAYYVQAFEEILKQTGVQPWIGDPSTILNPQFADVANQGIDESDALTILIGTLDRIPEDLRDKLQQALELNKTIFLLGQYPLSPEYLQTVGLDTLKWIPIESSGAAGASCAAQMITHVLTYARLALRTREWQQQEYKTSTPLSKGDLEKTQQHIQWIQGCPDIDLSITPEQTQYLEHLNTSVPTSGQNYYFKVGKPDIFISYSRRNKTFAEKIANYLKMQKYVLWVDWENIPIAADWREEAKEGIQEAHTFIFVISHDSLTSQPCLWELKTARDNGCRIIPVVCCHDYAPDILAEVELSTVNYISFEREPYEKAIQTLTKAIQSDFQDSKRYNALYNRALEWYQQDKKATLLLDAEDYKRTQRWLKHRSERQNSESAELSSAPDILPLQREFVNESNRVLLEYERQKLTRARNNRHLITLACSSVVVALGWATAYAQLGELRASVMSVTPPEDVSSLDRLVVGLRASQQLENRPYLRLMAPELFRLVTTNIHQEVISNREINILEGHDRGIFDVEYSPDGKHIISAGDDGTVRVWGGAQSMPEEEQPHTAPVVDVAYSSDGTFFVSGSYDGTVHLWQCLDNAACRWLEQLPGSHADKIVRVQVSPDDQYVVSASFDGTVNLWERTPNADGDDPKFSQPRQLLHTNPQANNPAERTPIVLALAFSPNRPHLVSADSAGQVNLWSLNNGEIIRSMDVGNSAVIKVAYSPDGKAIVMGGSNGLLKVWDWQQDAIATLPGHTGIIRDVAFNSQNGTAFNPEGHYLASSDSEGEILLWTQNQLKSVLETASDRLADTAIADTEKISSSLIPKVLKGHQGAVWRLEFSPDGQYLASASADDTVRLWLTADGALLDELEGHQDRVQGLAFSPLIRGDDDSETLFLASASLDGTVRTWRINNGVRPLPHQERIFDVAFHPDGQKLAAAGRRNINLWHLRNDYYSRFSRTFADNGDIYSVAYSPDGQWLVAGASTGNIILWQESQVDKPEPSIKWLHTGEEQESVEVRVVRFSPVDDFIISGGSDGFIRFWNWKGDSLGEQKTDGIVTSLDFSPDGQYAVVVTEPSHDMADGSIAIYRVKATPASIAVELKAKASLNDGDALGSILTVAFNPQASEFATGDALGRIRIWDTRGHLLDTLSGHSGSVTRVDYSHDGKLLASSSQDTYMNLWKATSGQRKLISSLKGHDRQVAKVAFNPKEPSMLASAGFDDKVLIWKIPEGLDSNPLQKLVPEGCESVREYLELKTDVASDPLQKLVPEGCESVREYLELKTDVASEQGFYSKAWNYFANHARNFRRFLRRGELDLAAEQQIREADRREVIRRFCKKRNE